MVNIIISSDPRYDINKMAIQEAVVGVLEKQNVTGRVEIEVVIAGDRKMHELNKKYRNIDDTTDVLSFALEESGRLGFVAAPDKVLRLGSIVISHPQAVEDAAMEGTSVDDEINFLVSHGTNHLLGIHHE